MKFKLIGGDHSPRGVKKNNLVYSRGDIVESSDDLIERYPGKFEKYDGPLPACSPKPANAGKKTKKKPEEQKKQVPKPSIVPEPPAEPEETLGEDVTKQFKEAKEAAVKVFKSDGQYFITESETPLIAINKDEISNKKEVVDFIKTLDAGFEESREDDGE